MISYLGTYNGTWWIQWFLQHHKDTHTTCCSTPYISHLLSFSLSSSKKDWFQTDIINFSLLRVVVKEQVVRSDVITMTEISRRFGYGQFWMGRFLRPGLAQSYQSKIQFIIVFKEKLKQLVNFRGSIHYKLKWCIKDERNEPLGGHQTKS